ncbi:MAG: phosphoesterase [Bacteroidetes bacterium]|nr:MAG: phosphoesterase [Bacteroidota bacterium]
MNLLHRIFFQLIIFSVLGQNSVAQYSLASNTRSLNSPGNYSLHFKFDSSNVKPKIQKGMLIAGGAMITYGILSLNVEFLKDWNEAVKDGVWDEKPHTGQHEIEDYLQWLPAASVYGLNLVGVKGKNNLRDRTMIYGMAMLLMSSSVYFTKKISNETRPDGSDTYSFPSGHTANAFVGAEFMRMEYKDKSPWYGIGGYAAAIATGYLRMYHNKHWLGDIVAGAGFGIVSTDISYMVYPAIKKWLFGKNKKEPSTIYMPTYNSGSFGLAMLHRF